MEFATSMFSLVFIVSAIVSIYWGLKIIALNPKAIINGFFLLICISLGIWSFGFAMANLSQSIETATLWRRFSAVGWTSIFSFMLHFLLLITSKRNDGNLVKYRLLIYIPAIINMYIFAFSTSMANVQYNLLKINYGWTNVAVNNGWDYFYYFYYSFYMIVSLVIVLKWTKTIKEKAKIRQAKIIFFSILASGIFASLTDIALNSLSSKALPQLAPLFVLIPVWSMYHAARHYDLICFEKKYKKETIVTEKEKQKIFNNISMAFIISGIFSFVIAYSSFMYNTNIDLKLGIREGFFLILTGTGIFIIQKIPNDSLKEAVTIFILVASIPLITFRFLSFSSITVWAFPIIIIIASLVFSKKTLLISTAVVSIITQLIIWTIHSQQTVVVDATDYIYRIIILTTVLAVSFYVNKMYVAKMEENNYRIRFQEMNARISSDFITINKENRDNKINQLLSEIGEFFNADRTYLFLINHEEDTMTYSHEWCNHGINPEVNTIENIPLATFPWWIQELQTNKMVNIGDTKNMPKSAAEEQSQLIRQNVKSLVSVPVEGEDRIKGFIGIDSVKRHKKWLSEDIKLLNVLSNTLSDALTKLTSEKKIEYMAYYDDLTDLPNRFLFNERVNVSIKSSKERKNPIYVLFMDLDNFKSVNDTIGHDGGDYVLKAVAENLKARVRKKDTVARFGGDEFMILLNGVKNQNELCQIADNIMSIFSKPINIHGQEFFISGSAGISTYPTDGEDPETLIKNADTAMYEAKSKGKNAYEICTTNMKDQVQKDWIMSKDLYYALERQELAVYYQPQMDLSNKKITGLEALLRWKHPEFGMIPPKVFIPIAERNGLINNIGEWVLKTACSQNKQWQSMGLGKIKMAVNLSGIQFINPHISDQVQRVLKETGLEPQYLEIEITESIAIRETEFVVEVLNKLKKIGVSIAIDDFGTEYSSLSRLRMLPIDRIKIDMEFIHGIESNEKDKAITVTIIELARSLGLNVLAEGVETAPQLEFLSQKMCDYVQGYYYYKPMPAYEMEKILLKLENLDPTLNIEELFSPHHKEVREVNI